MRKTRKKLKPVISNGHDLRRIDNYRERNYYLGWNKKHLTRHSFCFECETLTCNNSQHRRQELNPIIRVPKKNASKKKWKEFYDIVRYFHGHIINQKYVVTRGIK